ncbi:MAG: DMT family transporter [Alphaproteobacteria bacterium]|nr:DMT family transporter [Alphaproteobacteria bacterium]
MLAVVIGFLGMLFFAASIPSTSLALEGFDPGFTTFTRAALAGLGAAVILLIARRPWPAKKHIRPLLTIAVMIAFAFPGFMAMSLTHVGPAHGAVVLGLIPLMSSSISVAMTGVKPPLGFWLASITAGVIVMIFALYESGTSLEWGDIYMVLGASATAYGFNLSGRLNAHMPSWEIICWSLVVILPVSLTGALLLWPGMPVASATTSLPWIWSGLIYSGLGAMLTGYMLFTMGLNMGGITRIGQLQYLQVFVTLGMAAAVNNDPLRLETLLTASIVTMLVIIAMRAKSR